ncbi:MAG: gliding motility-associated C-terminal domain-containing protein, partial [Crocinitomicaceae bacterium]|nr:gliding motility-associated C-terminal domain-containing protein [Crocinitomicaceae bacterium]
LAVIIGIISVQIIKRYNMRDAQGNPVSIPPKDASQIKRYLIGGSMFGLGWALLGACPGPMFALLCSGLTIMVIPNQPEYNVFFNDSTMLCDLAQGTITIQTNDNLTWSNGSSDSSFTPTQPGWQHFTVSNFCNTLADSVFIAIEAQVSCDILPHSNVLCEGGSLTIVAEVNNADIFGWDDNMNNQADITITQSGVYQFIASNDCGSCLQNVTIENSNFEADFVGSPEQGNAPLTVQITNNTNNAVSEEWFLNGVPIDLENETLIFDENGEYLLTLFAIGEDGCSSEGSQLFIVENKLIVNIPNVFTPNGDGVNDLFTITINRVGSLNFEILNRWGNIMQSGKIEVKPDEPVVLWDGMSIDTAANDGVYFYKINFQSSLNGTSKNWHGFFHLNR